MIYAHVIGLLGGIGDTNIFSFENKHILWTEGEQNGN